jgi:formylglycine-generating enzyme required for sulfatase activity
MTEGKMRIQTLFLLTCLITYGCYETKEISIDHPDGSGDTDTDADTDSDIDADTDTDCDDGATLADSYGVVWVNICGGSFQMGDPTGMWWKQPVHEVTIPTFEMTETEITVAQFGECVKAGSCLEPVPVADDDNCVWGETGFDEHPVNCVDFYQAEEFCAWMGGRLPSESEWEYAARSGGQNVYYPWGDEMPTCEYVVMDDPTPGSDCIKGGTQPVCSKTIGNSEQGLCDMTGNVFEWVQDGYHGSYDCDNATSDAKNCDSGGVAPADGSAWGMGTSGTRVVRGGSWTVSDYLDLRVSARFRSSPANAHSAKGFRCLRSQTAPEPYRDPLECRGGRFDKKTGLCWQHPFATSANRKAFSWEEAVDYCEALSVAGHDDWYLPSREDFVNLLGGCEDEVLEGGAGSCDSCSTSASSPSANCSALLDDIREYWTSTKQQEDKAWKVSLSTSISSLRESLLYERYYARCVYLVP